jgi:hypothetical protein
MIQESSYSALPNYRMYAALIDGEEKERAAAGRDGQVHGRDRRASLG